MQIMKKTGKTKKTVRLLLAVMLAGVLGSAGCGNTEDAAAESSKNQTAEDNGIAAEAASGDAGKAMGRYVEKENDFLTDKLYAGGSLTQMKDGSLVIMNKTGKWVSRDKGAAWEREQLVWYEELKASYILDITVSPDGYTGVIYTPEEESEEEEPAEDESAERDLGGAPEADPVTADEKEEGEELRTDIDFTLEPVYRIVSPDGTITEFEIPSGDAEYLERLFFSEDGRLFGAALNGEIYEIDRDTGDYKLVTELSGYAFYLTVKDNIMVCENTEGLTVIDLDTGEQVEDKVLDDFIAAQLGASIESHNMVSIPAVVIPQKDRVLYLICEKGIFRHVIGGSAVEQVADGALMSLGNPSHGGIRDAILFENGVFLVLFADNLLAGYTYDPDMPTQPDIRLTAYSLRENMRLKEAVMNYQTEHPEVYIECKTGMDDASAVTREDALKKLNMEIAAGNEPDLLILDDMPVDSYMEKGILADLTPYLADKSGGGYFKNILDTFHTEEGTWAVPVEFRLPVMVGEQEKLAQITDLASFAGTMEQYRLEHKEGSILGTETEEALLARLLPGCAPAWKKADGSISRAALKEFYTGALKYVNREDKVTLKTAAGKEELVIDYLQEEENNPGFYRAVVYLPEGKGSPGMSATLIKSETSESYACCIPIQALHSEDSGKRHYVYLAAEREGILGREKYAEKRYVKVLDQNDEYAALEESSLTENEAVITGADKEIESSTVIRGREE